MANELLSPILNIPSTIEKIYHRWYMESKGLEIRSNGKHDRSKYKVENQFTLTLYFNP